MYLFMVNFDDFEGAEITTIESITKIPNNVLEQKEVIININGLSRRMFTGIAVMLYFLKY